MVGSVWRGFYRCLRTAEYFLVVLGPRWDAAIQMTTESQAYSHFGKESGSGGRGSSHVQWDRGSVARFGFQGDACLKSRDFVHTLLLRKAALTPHSRTLTHTLTRTRVAALM